jgi:hypothetical protein
MRLFPGSVIAASCLLAATVRADNYTYTLIDQLDNTYTAPFGLPSVNASGVVAYVKPLTTGGSDRGLFVSTSSSPLVTSSSSPYIIPPNTSFLTINNSGVVASAVALDAGGGGIITVAQGSGPTLLYQTSPNGFAAMDHPWINNNGVVAFSAAGTSSTSSAYNGIFKGTGATLTSVIDQTTALMVPGPQRIAINDAGTVAFGAVMAKTGYTLMTAADGQTPVPLTDETGPIKVFYSPLINNSGRVAFLADFDSFTGRQVQTMQVGSPDMTTIVDVSGPFSNALMVALNDNNRVVFTALLDGAIHTGVYDGSDPVANKVLAPGDQILGKEVVFAYAQASSLNNNNQVAMYVGFSDFSQAIVLATPVPEPASALLLIPGLLLLRRRR